MFRPSVWKTVLGNGFIILIILKLLGHRDVLVIQAIFPYVYSYLIHFLKLFFIGLLYCYLLLGYLIAKFCHFQKMSCISLFFSALWPNSNLGYLLFGFMKFFLQILFPQNHFWKSQPRVSLILAPCIYTLPPHWSFSLCSTYLISLTLYVNNKFIIFNFIHLFSVLVWNLSL